MNNKWWQQRSLGIVMVVSFLSILGFGVQRVVLPWHMKEVGINASTGGAILSLYGVSRAVMNIGGGILTDTFSRKINFAIGVALYGLLGYGLLAFSSSAFSVVVARTVIGLGVAWGTTAAMAILTDYSTLSNRGTIFGIQKGFFWAGITLSGYVGVILYPSLGIRGVMLLFSLPAVLSVFLIIFLLDRKTPVEASLEDIGRSKLKLANFVKFCGGDIRFAVLNLAGFLSKIMEDGLVLFIFPFFLAENEVAVALSVTLFTGAFAIFQPLGAILSDSVGRKKIILLGCYLSILGLAPLFFMGKNILALSVASTILGIGVGIVSPTAEATAGDLAPIQLRGSAIGYWRFFRDMGSFVGPLLLPVLFLKAGYLAVIIFLAGLITLTALGVHIVLAVKNEEY